MRNFIPSLLSLFLLAPALAQEPDADVVESELRVEFSESIDPLTLDVSSFSLFSTGPDGVYGSEDDRPVAGGTVTLDAAGRLAAIGSNYFSGERMILRIWNLETGEVRDFDQREPGAGSDPWEASVHMSRFAPDGTLYQADDGGVSSDTVD